MLCQYFCLCSISFKKNETHMTFALKMTLDDIADPTTYAAGWA